MFAEITIVMAKTVPDTTELALEVLKRARASGLPPRIGPENPELPIYVALVESGHLDGWVTEIETKVCAVLDARVTPLGEEFVDQFEGILRDPLWHTLRRPAWLVAGMALALGLLLILVSACQGGNSRVVEISSETTHRPCGSSPLQIFGVCGLPPVE